MKVSHLACACLALACAQLIGCGDPAGSREPNTASTTDAEADDFTLNSSGGAAAEVSARAIAGGARKQRDDSEERADSEGSGDSESAEGDSESAEGDSESAEGAAAPDCTDLDQAPPSCGQLSFKLNGPGSSCQLLPTVSDLTRSPRSVRFDCRQLVRGPDGYDYDALGHIALMGETCEALHRGGPHRVTLVLACAPG